MKKIEHSILVFILIEAIFSLFFFKLNYMEIILGFIFGLLLILLSNLIPKNNFFKFRLFISSIVVGIYSLIKISNFIKFYFLQNYSIIIIIISLLTTTIYLIKRGYHTFIKTVEIASYIYIFIKLLSFLLIIPKVNINNFQGIELTLSNYHFIYLSFAICLVYNSIYYITDNKPSIKIVIISLFNFLLTKILSILILGDSLSNIYNYPYINMLAKIKYFDFIERCDGILSFEYLICFYILLSYILLNTKLVYKKKHN